MHHVGELLDVAACHVELLGRGQAAHRADVATSCRTRTQNFVFSGAIPVDATAEACLDVCPEGLILDSGLILDRSVILGCQ